MTWETFLSAAEKCHKADHAFGIPLGVTTIRLLGLCRIARPCAADDRQGRQHHRQVRCDEASARMVQEAVPFLPSVSSPDDSSNNKALISAKRRYLNPPSAGVAVRDNPKVAEQLWTFPSPKGPRAASTDGAVFLGRVELLEEHIGGEELLTYLGQRSSVEQTVAASKGYDIPPSRNCTTSRPGQRKGRRRARSTTIRRAATLRR